VRAHQTDPSPRILLVEDDEAIRSTLTRGLYEQGATVVAVGTAVEAIRSLAGDRPEPSSWTSACRTSTERTSWR
jgi:CheY-like chemotaxis protein